MKLELYIKIYLEYCLFELRKTNSTPVIAIITILLDEDKTSQDVSKKLSQFGLLFNGDEIPEKIRFAKPEITWIVGYCYQYGFGVTKNLKIAKDLYSRASFGKFAIAMNSLGFLYANGEGTEKDLTQALKCYRAAANLGFAVAQTNLAFLLRNSEVVAQNLKQSFELITAAANQGYCLAQLELGLSYKYGNYGCENKDMTKAIEYCTLAADQGFAIAQFRLARIYGAGPSEIQNINKAFVLYTKASEQGLAAAQSELAICYMRGGLGVKNDITKAVEYTVRAATKADQLAQFYLGQSYRDGLGVEKNLKRAVLLMQAAIQNKQPNETRILEEELTILFNDGINYPNLDTAFMHYNKAQDNATLGFCLQFGLGVNRDFLNALKYYKKAIEQNYPCYLDLFYSFIASPFEVLEDAVMLEVELIKEFFCTSLRAFQESLLSEKTFTLHAEVDRDKLLCLARLCESGYSSLGFRRDVERASKYYTLASNLDAENTKSTESKEDKKAKEASKITGWITTKCNDYKTLIAYRKFVVKACEPNYLYNKAIAEIIADYAGPPNGMLGYTDGDLSNAPENRGFMSRFFQLKLPFKLPFYY